MNNTNSEAQGFSEENSAYGIVIPALATAAALDSSTFSSINANDAIPANWDDRARKAWEYYVEEPLVKNCVNSWRTFAVGDEIKITSDDDAVKTEANELADRLGVSEFVKDMILQLLVKGDAVGFKRYTKDGIKRTILSGIITGKGTDDMVRDLGMVIEDKESFRHAGSKVFSKAQYRMEMIARTEVLRAHNQGRIKFHQQVGVSKLEWMTMEDERTCPVCGGLDGKVFDTDHFPSQPAHPNCRCSSLPIVMCVKVPDGAGQSPCILSPQALYDQAKWYGGGDIVGSQFDSAFLQHFRRLAGIL